jgi:hypothetical protein
MMIEDKTVSTRMRPTVAKMGMADGELMPSMV